MEEAGVEKGGLFVWVLMLKRGGGEREEEVRVRVETVMRLIVRRLNEKTNNSQSRPPRTP